MLRMMKYEFRKSRFSYAILLAILGIVEVLFLGLNKFNVHYAIIPIILLIVMGIVADVWIMLSGVRMFSRDLKEKSGYMVYMTPVPIWQIVLSKVLVTFLVSAVFFIAYYALGILDMHLFHDALEANGDTSLMEVIAKTINTYVGTETLIALCKLFGNLLCNLFCFLGIVYFAIAMSNTLLRGKKGEGIVAFILFLVLYGLSIYIRFKVLPYGGQFRMEMTKSGVDFGLPGSQLQVALFYILDVVFGSLSIFGASQLLKKHIDL